jgi:hypothetical protein
MIKQVKIGARTYAIHEQDAEENSVFKEHEEAYGYIEYPTSEIYIRSDLEITFQNETLIHEILHGLLDNTGIDEINTDQITKALSPRLYAFLVDNPDFQQKLLSLKRS